MGLSYHRTIDYISSGMTSVECVVSENWCCLGQKRNWNFLVDCSQTMPSVWLVLMSCEIIMIWHYVHLCISLNIFFSFLLRGYMLCTTISPFFVWYSYKQYLLMVYILKGYFSVPCNKRRKWVFFKCSNVKTIIKNIVYLK